MFEAQNGDELFGPFTVLSSPISVFTRGISEDGILLNRVISMNFQGFGPLCDTGSRHLEFAVIVLFSKLFLRREQAYATSRNLSCQENSLCAMNLKLKCPQKDVLRREDGEIVRRCNITCKSNAFLKRKFSWPGTHKNKLLLSE